MPVRTNAQPAVAKLIDHAMREHHLSLRKFARLAVDPRSGYQISHHLAKSIRQGNAFRITPEVVRALAAGTNQPLRTVQLAVADQFMEFHPDTAPTSTEVEER